VARGGVSTLMLNLNFTSYDDRDPHPIYANVDGSHGTHWHSVSPQRHAQ